jgi:hypothetical protein
MDTNMDRELFVLVQDAKNWLASRPQPEILSPEWHTYNQLRQFIDLLQKDSSPESLDFAVQGLRRYMVKNFNWSVDCSTTVSRYCARTDQIRRRMSGTGMRVASAMS